MKGDDTAAVARRPRVVIHAEQCKGCGRCVVACANGVLILSNDTNSQGHLVPRASGNGCRGCGLCFYNCPEPGAITVYKRKAADKEKVRDAAGVAR